MPILVNWTESEAEAVFEALDDVCHHGVGFDEGCEWCEDEIAREEAEDRMDRLSGGA